MTSDALKEALERQKTGNAEEDYIEVISRALGVKREIVVRVIFAANAVDAALGEFARHPEFHSSAYGLGGDNYNADLPDLELRKAYRMAMANGVLRVIAAKAITDGTTLKIATASFLPRENAAELCHGCPEQLECVAENMSTPDRCWHHSKAFLDAKPLRMNSDSVEFEMEQPAGKRRISFNKLNIRR